MVFVNVTESNYIWSTVRKNVDTKIIDTIKSNTEDVIHTDDIGLFVEEVLESLSAIVS